MNKEIKERWIKALNSGEYKQGTTFLNGPNGYCCLGVLCDLAAKDGLGEWEGVYGSKTFISSSWNLPSMVNEWAGYINGLVVAELMGLNDSDVPFTEIAKVIEAKL